MASLVAECGLLTLVKAVPLLPLVIGERHGRSSPFVPWMLGHTAAKLGDPDRAPATSTSAVSRHGPPPSRGRRDGSRRRGQFCRRTGSVSTAPGYSRHRLGRPQTVGSVARAAPR